MTHPHPQTSPSDAPHRVSPAESLRATGTVAADQLRSLHLLTLVN
jgi:hypothetical protein